jgi:hypothetical protein
MTDFSRGHILMLEACCDASKARELGEIRPKVKHT